MLVSIITSLVTGWCNYQKRCVNEVRPKEDYGEDFGTQSYHKINEQVHGKVEGKENDTRTRCKRTEIH